MARKRLQMQRGTDEVNHAGESYKVTRSSVGDMPEGYVELPEDAAEHVLRQGGAIDLDDKPELPDGHIRFRHHSDEHVSFGFDGHVFEPDDDGIITAPAHMMESLGWHGFYPVR